MSMLQPMRNELFKYRKRSKRPIDGSAPGAPYADYRRSRRYVSGLPYARRQPGHQQNPYNWGVPREYHPNLNAPAVQSQEYWTNENWDSNMVRHSTDPRLFRAFPRLPVVEKEISYRKSKTASEFFLKVMEIMYRPFEEGQEIPTLADIWQEHWGAHEQYMPATEMTAETVAESTPEDVVRKFIDITGALGHLQTVLPPDHPDITNLRAALHDILDDPDAMSKLESIAGDSGPSNLGTGDPYENDPFEEVEQHFEQQMDIINRAFERPAMGLAEIGVPDEGQALSGDYIFDEPFIEQGGLEQIMEQEGLFDAELPDIVQEEMLPEDVLPCEALAEEQTLDDIVEQPFGAPEFMEQNMMPDEMAADMSVPGVMPEPAGYDAGMIADEINQAIDEVSAQPMPEEMELDPFAPQYDPFATAQQMFDQQMQYMANPFMMPAMGPMPGPMPGP